MAVADHLPAPARGGPFPGPANNEGRGRAAVRVPDVGLARERLPWPVAIYLLCLMIPIWFNAGPLLLSTLRLYLLVMIIPLLVQLVMGRFGRILLTDVLFMAHLAWATLALAINNPSQVV